MVLIATYTLFEDPAKQGAALQTALWFIKWASLFLQQIYGVATAKRLEIALQGIK